MVLTVGIDEVGYGPSLGPLVVAAAASRGKLRVDVPIADSKRIFSQARGVGSLEPAVLGFLQASTLTELLERLATRLPECPWYARPLALPSHPALPCLDGSWARFVEPDEFNAATRERNKSEFLFEVAASLINRIREARPGPIRFLVGKQGGRNFYLEGLRRRVHPETRKILESRTRSVYELPGARIEFLMDAEDRHELVALASMIGKYVRECAMKLFNQWWAERHEGLRPTAGYGADGRRFFREIEPSLSVLQLAREAVLRLR